MLITIYHGGITLELCYNSGHISNPFSPFFYPQRSEFLTPFYTKWPRIDNQNVLKPGWGVRKYERRGGWIAKISSYSRYHDVYGILFMVAKIRALIFDSPQIPWQKYSLHTVIIRYWETLISEIENSLEISFDKKVNSLCLHIKVIRLLI